MPTFYLQTIFINNIKYTGVSNMFIINCTKYELLYYDSIC